MILPAMIEESMERNATVKIRPKDEGAILIDFLSARFTYYTENQWEKMISEGRLRISGKTASAVQRLTAGDRVEFLASDLTEPAVDTGYSVIFEDEALIAVNKPGQLPCHPGGRYFRHSLWAMLRERSGEPHLHFIHRIDRETSGIVLIAKTKADARACRLQFEERSVEKRYRVGAEGKFPGTLDAAGFIGPDPDSPVRKKMRFSRTAVQSEAKACRTRFRLLKSSDDFSLVEAVPETGRTHQIRATLLGMGFPVIGDKIYGPDEGVFLRFIEDRMTEGDRRRLRLSRQALHAAEISLLHPRTGHPLRLRAPMPPDMAGLFSAVIS